jgi:hypothetical protein
MPTTLFLFEAFLTAAGLAILTGVFGIWCGSRYGATEKRYIIQGIPMLACAGMLMYLDWRHNVFWGTGIFNVVYFLTLRLNLYVRSKLFRR